MPLHLDHVIVAVNNLERATDDYRSLGFTVTPGGMHGNRATQNALIAFEDGTYIELLAVTDTEPVPGLIDFSVLARKKEGLVGYALRTDKIAADSARLKYVGLSVSDITPGERRRNDGTLVQWHLMTVEEKFSPFFIQDVTSHELRVPSDIPSTTHANQAIGIACLEIAVRSIKDSSERYRKILGLTKRDLDLHDARGFELKTGTLFLSEPAEPDPDWEDQVRKTGAFFSDAIQQHMLDTMQRTLEYHAGLLMVLSNGKDAEALFALRIIFDAAPNNRFVSEKTHNVRIEQDTGVSKRRELPIFEKMNRGDWSHVSHAYGPATDTPANIRALVSNNKTVRENAYHRLNFSIVHQGTVYEATVTALPYLIELLAAPETPDKHALLDLIQYCGGVHPDDSDSNDEDLSSYEQKQNELRRSLWRIFLTGRPLYKQLLEHPDARVRQAATSAFAATGP